MCKPWKFFLFLLEAPLRRPRHHTELMDRAYRTPATFQQQETWILCNLHSNAVLPYTLAFLHVRPLSTRVACYCGLCSQTWSPWIDTSTCLSTRASWSYHMLCKLVMCWQQFTLTKHRCATKQTLANHVRNRCKNTTNKMHWLKHAGANMYLRNTQQTTHWPDC